VLNIGPEVPKNMSPSEVLNVVSNFIKLDRIRKRKSQEYSIRKEGKPKG